MQHRAAVQGAGMPSIPPAEDGGSAGRSQQPDWGGSGARKKGRRVRGDVGQRQQCWQLEKLPTRRTGFCSTLSYFPVPFCALTTWL